MANRIHYRLRCEALSPKDLRECLCHLLRKTGNPRLIAEPVINTLCEHAAGNYRALMNMANDLLAAALQREAAQIDEAIFLEIFDLRAASTQRSKS